MNPRPTMPRDELEAVGQAIYGTQWVTPMARDLRKLTGGPADRTAQRWASGANPIPATLRDALCALIEVKIAALKSALKNIDTTQKSD